MTRREALSLPNTEPTINGRCVGQLQNDPKAGTVLAFLWHDPAGCEHTTEIAR